MIRYLRTRIFYSLTFVLTVWACQAVAGWREPFSLEGTASVTWNILRFVLAILTCLLAAGCGALVSRPWFCDWDKAPRDIGDLLLWLLAGGAAISLANYLLGLAGLYEFHVYGFLALGILFWSAPALHRALGFVGKNAFRPPTPFESPYRGFAGLHYVALTFCLIALVQSFLVKVLCPDYGGSIFYYFFYFNKIKATHHIIPNYFDAFTSFPTKASGLHYLMAMLTDVETLTVASVPALCLLFLTSYLFVKDISESRIYPLLGIVVITMNSEFIILTNNFSKTNFTLSVIIFAFAYLSYLLILKKDSRPRATLLTLSLLIAQLGLFTGMIFFYACGMVVLVFLFASRLNNKYQIISLHLLVILLLVYGICGLINYYFLGIFDHSSLSFQLKNNLVKFSDYYINYTNLDFLNLIQRDSKLVPTIQSYLKNLYTDITSTGFLPGSFSPLAWILLGISLLVWPWHRRSPGSRALFFWFLFNLFLLLGLMLFRSMIASEYVRKHSSLLFGVYFKTNLYIFSFILFRELVITRLPSFSRYWGKFFYDLVILLFVCFQALFGHPYNLRDDFREVLAFVGGDISAKAVFSRYYPDLDNCQWALDHLRDPGTRLLPLALYTMCTGYSRGRSVDPTEPFPIGDYWIMFHGIPGEAIRKFQELGIDYFLFDFHQEPRNELFAPIFEPDQLERYFKIVAARPGIYLLTWNDFPEQKSKFPDAFFQEYAAYRDQSIKQHFDDSYSAKMIFLESKIAAP